MQSYNEGIKIYWDMKQGKRKQYARPVPRETIEVYKEGFTDGFLRGYNAGIKGNRK